MKMTSLKYLYICTISQSLAILLTIYPTREPCPSQYCISGNSKCAKNGFLKYVMYSTCKLATMCYCRRRSLIGKWLNDCEEFGLKYASNCPVLYYHLSLINALAKLPEQSRKDFHSYILKYVLCVCIVCMFVCMYNSLKSNFVTEVLVIAIIITKIF